MRTVTEFCNCDVSFVSQRKPSDEDANVDDAKKPKTVDTKTVTDAAATVSTETETMDVCQKKPEQANDDEAQKPESVVTETDGVADTAVAVSVPAATETVVDSETVVNGCSDAVNGATTDEPAAVNGCEQKMEVTGDSEIKVRNFPSTLVFSSPNIDKLMPKFRYDSFASSVN